ncbi:hypothetical protein [Paenibacillus methanolicus]|uniref:Uncharacterized protein n=1 Tax=Paenibacillus methanolicus TaxID=582686 RepID=A0A5S5CM63_9BACL|nr:hypothetical protein [Paenibacillus methanolicus]TYP79478.1 hypothetical protein BCM02_101596 [Paenibacillus methanolicus]
MDFLSALTRYVGRRVEVFQTTQYVSGILIGVGDGFFHIQTSGTAYGGEPPTTISAARTELVRIIA